MNLNLTTVTRYGLNVLAALGASIALFLGQSVFIPLTIAGLLAAILYPAVMWFHTRLRFPWFFSCISVLSMAVLVVLLVIALIVLSVPQMLNDLPKPNDPASLERTYERLHSQFDKSLPVNIEAVFPKDPNNSGVFLEIKKFLLSDQFTSLLLSLSGTGIGILAQAVLIMFMMLFLLVEGQMLADKTRNIFSPAAEVQRDVSRVFQEMAESIRSYLVWRTIVNVGIGVVLGIFYYLLGLKQPVLWALITVILSYIPYLGTIAAGVLPLFDAIINVSPLAALLVILFYMMVTTVEGYLVVPWVMGRSMDLNATTVLLSCLYWYLIWGTAGLFLAMPLMAAIKAVCMSVPSWRPWGALMGSEETTVAKPVSAPSEVELTIAHEPAKPTVP
jgi:predicted PurR-regulated permease PerM